MSSATDTFKPLSAALASGSIANVLACLDPESTVVVKLGTEVTSLTGQGLQKELESLLSAFESLTLTAVSRSLSDSSITEEAVFSGNHVGAWGAIQPTHRRVSFNVRLVAAPDGAATLQHLRVEPDARSLLAQIAETEDIFGVTAGLIATVHERETRPVPLTGDGSGQANKSAVDAPSRSKARIKRHRARRMVLIAVLLVALMAVAGWRLTLARSSAADVTARPVAAVPHKVPTASKSPVKSTSPVVRKVPVKVVARQPVIATPAPKAAPRVQAGRQVVLSSDVLFGPASSVVAPGARAALLKVARDVRRAKVRGTVQVNGYTDATGSPATNLALSRTRAVAVARVLQPALAGLRIVLAPQGFGEASPLTTNKTNAGQARNRRVTIVLPK